MNHHYRLKSDPSSSHQQIAGWVSALKRGPILDVGSAQGMFGQLLAKTNLPIDAIEPNPVWADAARSFYRTVHACAVEDALPPPQKYAIVICGDVLEHVVDPVGVLKQLIQFAEPDAHFIVSLPNVAHLAVRLLLLFGKFPQMSRGILDRTHLHFYTRATAEQMLCDAGLRIVRVSSTPVPLGEPGQRGVKSLLRTAGMGLQHIGRLMLPRAFAMQWIFLAQPRGDA